LKINKKYNNLKYFFVSMIVSEIFLMLFLGLIIAEHNIRYIILGSEDSFFTNSISTAREISEFIFMRTKIKLNLTFFTGFMNFIKNINLKSYFCFV